MGKRSDFPRNGRDFYSTPPEGMAPLLPHIARGATFCEPCAGAGHMVDYFESAGHPCVFACDVEPQVPYITRLPATSLADLRCDLFITNPPWLWSMLEPIAMHLSGMKPTWLLLPADLAHNVRSATLVDRCVKIVPIGRLKWIPGSKHAGVDNAVWMLFQPDHKGGPRFSARGKP